METEYKQSQETRDKIRDALTGVPTPEITKFRMRIAAAKRERVECPHCGKVGAVNVMPRWHFDNCRDK